MDKLLIAALTDNTLWYALPLVMAVSLVYAATRHERMESILPHALRVGVWIVAFMGIVLAVMVAASWLMRVS